MTDPNLIASMAAFFTMIGYLPQAIKTIKTRDTKAISFWMYFFSIVGVIFWLIFGIMIGNKPIIFKNIAVIILGGTVLWIKLGNIIKGKDEAMLKIKFFKPLKKFFNQKKS